jgi:hypothetical protein
LMRRKRRSGPPENHVSYFLVRHCTHPRLTRSISAWAESSRSG